MAERVNIGYSVKAETKNRIDALSKITHRFPGHLIDLLVEEAWDKYETRKNLRGVSAVDQAMAEIK